MTKIKLIRNLLKTDFYQINMTCALILSGKATIMAGFEGFYRHPKKEVSSNVYYYSGEKQIIEIMDSIKEELASKSFIDDFMKLIKCRFTSEQEDTIRNFFETNSTSIEYSVYKEDCVLPPLVPAFQVKTQIWLGLMIETIITNAHNGRTGLNTKIHLNQADEEMKAIVNEDRTSMYWDKYKQKLRDIAMQYRSITDKPIMDASFRRAPSYKISVIAAKIALEEGFNSTSHCGAFLAGEIPLDKVNGTMSHAFIMLFPTEREAFISWNRIFKNTIYLVDTYDVLNAIQTIIDLGIFPYAIRIDSGDFFTLPQKARDLLDQNDLKETKIYLSGDITPELVIQLEEANVPFDMFMVGTKYVNLDGGASVNSGFVYKIVEYTLEDEYFSDKIAEWHESNQEEPLNEFLGLTQDQYIELVLKQQVRILPEKKAEGKGNYPGLKTVTVVDGNVILEPTGNIGFSDLNLITENSKVIFKRD